MIKREVRQRKIGLASTQSDVSPSISSLGYAGQTTVGRREFEQ